MFLSRSIEKRASAQVRLTSTFSILHSYSLMVLGPLPASHDQGSALLASLQ